MTDLWEWNFCEKCNTWTEHDSSTGGNICRRCKFVSKAIVVDLKKQKEQKLENDILTVLSHIEYNGAKYKYMNAFVMSSEDFQKENMNELLPLAKAIISWVRKK